MENNFFEIKKEKNKYVIVDKNKKIDSNTILVSVILLVYNQEDYVKQALDSITMQKTDFKFEVIIGNDGSSDGTAKILNNYKNKNKNCQIITINREKNLGTTKNNYDCMKRAKGKYIAFLEGDDYWIDENKLQKQFDFIETHNEYVGVASDNEVVDPDCNYISKRSIQQNRKKKITCFKDLEKGYLLYHSNTVLLKNIYFLDKINSTFIYRIDPFIGDNVTPLLVCDFGDIYIMDDVTLAYRDFNRFPNRNAKNYLEHTLVSLEMSSKLEKEKFLNHKLDSSYRKANSIIVFWIIKIFKKQKYDKELLSKLKNYISFKVVLFMPICFVKFTWKNIVKKIKNK